MEGERASELKLGKSSAIWIAVVLWLASSAFVTMVSRISTWEGIASYRNSADLCRYDCVWFAGVLTSGYDAQRHITGEANWVFHPGQPLAAYPLHYWLGLSTATSLVLASKIALLFAIYGFLLMLSDQIDSSAEQVLAGALVAFNPYIIYGHAGYSEALYFALLTFGFYFASKKKWILSGLMGALLGATRMVAFLFTASYVIIVAQRYSWRRVSRTMLAGLALCPLGTLLYMAYLHHHTGDALAQAHAHVYWVNTQFSDPFTALWRPLHEHHWPRVWAMMVIVGFVASAWLFKLKKPELGTYLALSILVALLGGTFLGELYAMPRYIWWQPPFLYAIYIALRRHIGWWLIYVAFASGMASFMILEWFTGHSFVW